MFYHYSHLSLLDVSIFIAMHKFLNSDNIFQGFYEVLKWYFDSIFRNSKHMESHKYTAVPQSIQM